MPLDSGRASAISTQRARASGDLALRVAAADAPKGVLYRHFPGGKQALAVAAVQATAAHIHASPDRRPAP